MRNASSHALARYTVFAERARRFCPVRGDLSTPPALPDARSAAFARFCRYFELMTRQKIAHAGDKIFIADVHTPRRLHYSR